MWTALLLNQGLHPAEAVISLRMICRLIVCNAPVSGAGYEPATYPGCWLRELQGVS